MEMDRFANRYRQILQDKANMGLGYGGAVPLGVRHCIAQKKVKGKIKCAKYSPSECVAQKKGKSGKIVCARYAPQAAGVAVGGIAQNNPWIMFLFSKMEETGLPYGALMRDRSIKNEYRSFKANYMPYGPIQQKSRKRKPKKKYQ